VKLVDWVNLILTKKSSEQRSGRLYSAEMVSDQPITGLPADVESASEASPQIGNAVRKELGFFETDPESFDSPIRFVEAREL
jgi:hypothetical protein